MTKSAIRSMVLTLAFTMLAAAGEVPDHARIAPDDAGKSFRVLATNKTSTLEKELNEAAAEGYAFYALDLRKHGRSWLAHQHPCFCKDLAEYDADITAAIDEIGGPVLLAGHSTGGLICSLYAARGERRDQVRALWLNSPFFDWKVTPFKRAQLGMAALTGQAFPFLNDPKALSPAYIRSIHRDFGGEWDFDLKLKPLHGFPAYFGWVGAVLAAQHKVHAGLTIQCPVLTLHSDEADIVLDWRHMAKWGRTLGPSARVLAFPGGLHDLVLSPREVREAVFSALFSWGDVSG